MLGGVVADILRDSHRAELGAAYRPEVRHWHDRPDRARLLKLLVTGSKRAAVVRAIEGEFLAAEVAPIEEQRGRTANAFTLMRAVLEAYRNSLSSPPQTVIAPPHIPQAVVTQPPASDPSTLAEISEPGMLADAVAPLLSIGIDKKQQILETSDVVTRLETILDIMKTGREAT